MILVEQKNIMAKLNRIIFFGALLVMSGSAISAQSDKLQFSATVVKGLCEISVTDSEIIFPRQYIIMSFNNTDAVDVKEFNLIYKCRDYDPGNVDIIINAKGTVAPNDTKLFLDPNAIDGAKGVGFMLKNGSNSQIKGFYNAANTILPNANFSKRIVYSETQKEGVIPLSVGLVKQSGTAQLTPGKVKATVTFDFVIQ